MEWITTVYDDALREPGGALRGRTRRGIGHHRSGAGLLAGLLRGTTVGPDELPGVIDEIPLLALVAAHADSESRFEGAGELRVKESDRLLGLARGIRELGGEAEVQGDALVVAGGGLAGGTTDARGDHRLAMAFAVGALAARAPCTVTGMEWAEVSFPGFVWTLRRLGVEIGVAE